MLSRNAAAVARSSSSYEHRRELAAHVPLHMIGEQAQKHVRARPRRQPMEQGPDAQVDALEAPERALHLGERLVGPHRPGIVERRRGQVRAHHVEAVERRLGRDRGRVAAEAERIVRDC